MAITAEVVLIGVGGCGDNCVSGVSCRHGREGGFSDSNDGNGNGRLLAVVAEEVVLIVLAAVVIIVVKTAVAVVGS